MRFLLPYLCGEINCFGFCLASPPPTDSRLAYVHPQASFHFVMQAADAIWTEEELMRLPHDGCKCELVDGKVLLSRAGMEHALSYA